MNGMSESPQEINIKDEIKVKHMFTNNNVFVILKEVASTDSVCVLRTSTNR